jgi:hypothetical protein
MDNFVKGSGDGRLSEKRETEEVERGKKGCGERGLEEEDLFSRTRRSIGNSDENHEERWCTTLYESCVHP